MGFIIFVLAFAPAVITYIFSEHPRTTPRTGP